tara:strand:+ start:1949 stop:2059 length:111 start_codon:yes stop_codon:yes gene_type:complete
MPYYKGKDYKYNKSGYAKLAADKKADKKKKKKKRKK